MSHSNSGMRVSSRNGDTHYSLTLNPLLPSTDLQHSLDVNLRTAFTFIPGQLKTLIHISGLCPLRYKKPPLNSL